MTDRPQFNLMISFWNAGKELPDEMRLAYYDALLHDADNLRRKAHYLIYVR